MIATAPLHTPILDRPRLPAETTTKASPSDRRAGAFPQPCARFASRTRASTGSSPSRSRQPEPGAGEALVRVHAAAITRDELDWPTDRLPAIPSYELRVSSSGGARRRESLVGEAVYALTPFDRDGAAADYAVVPSELLARKPQQLGHVESAAVPLAALSAWQALYDHGQLSTYDRVLIHGATGGVGQFATQLAPGAAPT